MESSLPSAKKRCRERGLETDRLVCGHLCFEPVQSALEYVSSMGRVMERMSLVRVYHQLRLYALGTECMPELEALRSGAFAVATTDHDEGWCLYFLDVFDR